ncbi:hypothetical protein DY000_02021699 [Brassica cretica]|uniref:RNase H type-1 domain-containing protein n=1 Tax=Brassica cretica TaxID=69181 RepID=A0ABQ7EEW4_BRACR|nr:hypothetical protein DY000_02021699 [Brassica cretica]
MQDLTKTPTILMEDIVEKSKLQSTSSSIATTLDRYGVTQLGPRASTQRTVSPLAKLSWRQAQSLCYHRGDCPEISSHGSFGAFGQQGTSIFSKTESRRLWRFLLRPYAEQKNGTMPKPWHATSSRAGCGWIFISQQDEQLHQGTTTFENTSSSLVAEALAIRSALLNALEAGFTRIWIKTDCQALVALINLKNHPKDLYGIFRDTTGNVGINSVVA